jgi:hypothetical protein
MFVCPDNSLNVDSDGNTPLLMSLQGAIKKNDRLDFVIHEQYSEKF